MDITKKIVGCMLAALFCQGSVFAASSGHRGALASGAGREQRIRVFLARNLKHKKKNVKSCAICREPIKSIDIFHLHCAHDFHKHCIKAWFGISQTCPLCRKAATGQDLLRLGLERSGGLPAVPQPNHKLLFAAGMGHGAMVEEALAEGADPCYQSLNNAETSLMVAAEHGHVAIVQRLLAVMPVGRLDVRNIYGETALLKAFTSGHIDIARILLQAGADPSICSNNGTTALHCAVRLCREDIVTMFLTNQRMTNAIVLNLPAALMETPLMLACRYGFAGIVRRLLNAGADAELARNIFGKTTMQIARESGNAEIIRLIEVALFAKAAGRSGAVIEALTPATASSCIIS